jgi:hypothetical protein
MRTQLLMFGAAEPSQGATWAPRKLLNFGPREAKAIPRAVCDKADVGLRAQVLELPSQWAISP